MRRAPFQVAELPDEGLLIPGGELNFIADQKQASVDDLVNMAQEVQRSAVVDGYNDCTCKDAAPECSNPFSTVFRPDDDFVALANIVFK